MTSRRGNDERVRTEGALTTPDMTPLNSRLQLALLNHWKSRNLLEKGFTLVELMIVIVIVGILSAVALPNFLSQTGKAKLTEAQGKVSAGFKQAQAIWVEDGNFDNVTCEDIGFINSGSAQTPAFVENGWTYTCTAVGGNSGVSTTALQMTAIGVDPGPNAGLGHTPQILMMTGMIVRSLVQQE